MNTQEELEQQFKFKNEPLKDMLKKAEKKENDKKKPIDPKYIFENINLNSKNYKKKKYRKPEDKKNNLEFDKMEDMIFQ